MRAPMLSAALSVLASALGAQTSLRPSGHEVPYNFRGACAYDAHRSVVVMTNHSALGVWEWDGGRWTFIDATVPGSVGFATMSYDAARGVCLLLTAGGMFAWDGAEWTVVTPAAMPPRRTLSAMVYDPVRDRTILFGGDPLAGSGELDDTWEWDGATWTEIATAVRPPARSHHAMFWDPVRERVVMFGGLGPLWLDDTWEYDGATWTAVATPGPGARANHAVAYDYARGRGVLFGGERLGDAFGDTWEWDSATATWSLAATSGPSPRNGPVMAYDVARDQVVSYGGVFLTEPDAGETWGYRAGTWSRLADNGTPTAGGGAGYDQTYDWLRRVLVRVANRAGTNTVEVWEWGGETWTRRRPPSSPVVGELGNFTVRVAFDPHTGTVLAQLTTWDRNAGFGTETWEWDGRAETWTRLQPAVQPPTRSGHALAYDLAGDRIILFGGVTFATRFDDTWAWDRAAQSWVRLNPQSSPPARYNAALATDLARERVVLFGGATSSTQPQLDTWEWTGTDWVQGQPSVVPAASTTPSLTYDVARDRAVLVGGSSHLFPNPTDFWEWDGSDWMARQPSGSLPLQAVHQIAHDPARGESIVLSGCGGAAVVQRYGPTDPAAHVRFGTGCAGSAGVPRLVSGPFDNPWIGDVFTAAVESVAAGAVGTMLLGLSNASWGGFALPLPLDGFGLPGCALLSSIEATSPLVVSPTPGELEWSVAIPATRSLLGREVHHQALVLDPLAPGGIGVLTNGATMRFGSR